MLVEEEGNLRDGLARAVAAGKAETGLRLAVGLEPFWLAHGRWYGAAESLDDLVHSPSLDAPLAAEHARPCANLHLMAGRYDRAEAVFEEARELAERIGSSSTIARHVRVGICVPFLQAQRGRSLVVAGPPRLRGQ